MKKKNLKKKIKEDRKYKINTKHKKMYVSKGDPKKIVDRMNLIIRMMVIMIMDNREKYKVDSKLT